MILLHPVLSGLLKKFWFNWLFPKQIAFPIKQISTIYRVKGVLKFAESPYAVRWKQIKVISLSVSSTPTREFSVITS